MPIDYNTYFRTALIVTVYKDPACKEKDVVTAQTLAAVPAGLFEMVLVSDCASSDAAYAAGATVVSDSGAGYGDACRRAIAVLPETIDAVVFLDPGQMTAAVLEQVPKLIAPIRNNDADLVLAASPRTPGFAAALATGIIRLFWRHSYAGLSPLRAIRADALRALGMLDRGEGWPLEMQIRALQQGLRVTDVPVPAGLPEAGVAPSSFRVLSTILRLLLFTGA